MVLEIRRGDQASRPAHRDLYVAMGQIRRGYSQSARNPFLTDWPKPAQISDPKLVFFEKSWWAWPDNPLIPLALISHPLTNSTNGPCRASPLRASASHCQKVAAMRWFGVHCRECNRQPNVGRPSNETVRRGGWACYVKRPILLTRNQSLLRRHR